MQGPNVLCLAAIREVANAYADTTSLSEKIVFFGCFVLFGLAGVLARGLDHDLLLAIYGQGDVQIIGFWRAVSFVGSGPILFSAVGVAGLILLWRNQRITALGFLMGWALTSLTVDWVKWLLGRERPTLPPLTSATGAAFPSGHAAQAAYVCFLLGMVLWHSRWLTEAGLWGNRFRRVCLGILGAVPLAVGYSRVYLGVHWPSDVLGGWAVGLFFSALVWLIPQTGGASFSQSREIQSPGAHASVRE